MIPQTNEQSTLCIEPGLIRASLLSNLQGPAPHQLLEGQAELIIFEGQYLLHWLDERGQDQFKFLSASSVSGAFSETNVESGWLPPGVAAWGKSGKGTWMVLWMPPQRHTITLLGEAMPEGPVSFPLPGLIFAGVGERYYLWASKEETFAPTNPLYSVPLPNVGPDGAICFGPDNHPPAVGAETMLDAWRLFIGSPFNADWTGSKSEKYRSDIRHQLCAVRKKTRYPVSDLVSARSYSVASFTVADAVERLLKAGSDLF